MARTKPKAYGYKHVKQPRKKRKGRHAKNKNPKHKVYKKYIGQGRWWN